ncbi:hypothetical protein M422DRAFT_255029, partial [Sphaerobolus stellatus SS14]
TSLSSTPSDPDAPISSTNFPIPSGASQSASPSVQPIPANLPAKIFLPTSVGLNNKDDGDLVKDKTLIGVLFTPQLNWPFVYEHNQSMVQIFAFMPMVISGALGIDPSQVVTYALEVNVPTGWTGEDPTALGTTYLAYIPSSLVDDLNLMIRTPNSRFYAQGGIGGELANFVIPSFPLTAVSLTTLPGAVSSSTSSKTSKTRRDALIGVCAAAGGICIVVLVWWLLRAQRRKKEKQHKRLSEFTDPNWSGGVYGTHNDDRRTSFFYAADQLNAGWLAEPPREAPSPPSSPVVAVNPPQPQAGPSRQSQNQLNGHAPPQLQMQQVNGSSPLRPAWKYQLAVDPPSPGANENGIMPRRAIPANVPVNVGGGIGAGTPPGAGVAEWMPPPGSIGARALAARRNTRVVPGGGPKVFAHGRKVSISAPVLQFSSAI